MRCKYRLSLLTLVREGREWSKRSSVLPSHRQMKYSPSAREELRKDDELYMMEGLM